MKSNQTKPKWTKHPSLRHFKNGFKLRINPSRVSELVQFLEDSNLDEHVCRWETTAPYQYQDAPLELMISFRHRKYAALFKLSWILCDVNDEAIFNRIVIGLVRRHAVTQLVNEICSVQPMTGPASQIYSLRSRYTDDPE